jgi:hypothetical protein
MKVPKACGAGHRLNKDNVRFYTNDGRDRWRCKECDRISRIKRNKTPVKRQRGPYERLEPGPFLRWFEGYAKRYQLSRKEAARSLNIDDKSIRRAYAPDRSRHESGMLSVAMVDKALLYMDTNIRDLYPELYPDED